MWILSFLPDWFLQWAIHGTVIIGLFLTLGGSLLKLIPLIAPYSMIAKQIGIVLLVVGVFFEGGYATEMAWRTKVNEMQAMIAEAEKKSAQVNKKLSVKLNNTREVIKDKVNENNKAIKDNQSSVNAECRVNDTAWMLYNRAVESKISASTSTNDGTSTRTKTSSSR